MDVIHEQFKMETILAVGRVD